MPHELSLQLFCAAVEQVRQNVPGFTMLQVHSSPVAVPIYEALGSSVTGPEEVEGGMRYIPIELLLLKPFAHPE